MEPLSKGPKLSGGSDTRRVGVDRISNLPTDLIGNILSLLPTKEAVATSVLSTKWQWFWTFTTGLDFFDHPKNRRLVKGKSCGSVKERFTNFVYGVLLRRKATPLKYFRITSCNKGYASHVRAWVSAVLPTGLEELDLSIPLWESVLVFPYNLFSCKSLVKLKLGTGIWLRVPSMVCLPSLEVLILTDVKFRDDGSLNRLLIGCPVLEEFESIGQWGYLMNTILLPLELFSCKKLAKVKLGSTFVMNLPAVVSLPSLEALHLFCLKNMDDDSLGRFLMGCPLLRQLELTTHDMIVLHIDVPTLSHLKLDFSTRVPNGKVVLDTPSLQYLKVRDIASSSLEVVTDLSQLVEADINHILQRVFRLQFQVASTLIMAISRVQTLYLSGYVMEAIAEHGFKLPMFHDMTTLKLGVSNKVGWALLPELLENAPVLETLVFQEGLKEHRATENATWYAPLKVPYCLIHHLKVIQVNHFQGADIEEEEMIRYFIESRGILKDLAIQYCSGSGDFFYTNVAKWQ